RRHANPPLRRLSPPHSSRWQRPAPPLWLRQLRPLHARLLQLQSRQPPRPRHHLRYRPHPRGRRTWQALARRRPHAPQAQHLHRFHRFGKPSHRRKIHLQGNPRRRRRQRRRPPHGRYRQHASRSLPHHHQPRPLRGCPQHHARRLSPPHHRRIRGMGHPSQGRRLFLHEVLLPLHQPHHQGLSRHARQNRPQRQPGHVLGAR